MIRKSSQKTGARKTTKKKRGRILVTGAAGFIGSALVHELNRRGYSDILAVDVLGRDLKWKNLSPLAFADYLQADELLSLVENRPGALGRFSAVFHLGACSATTETDGDYLIRNNYRFTKVLADWAVGHRARFVYASSAATYGDGNDGMDDRSADIGRLRPLNLYGYSKQLFDLHALRRGIAGDIVGIKYFNVFGPNEGHKGEMRSLVAKAYEQILATGRLRLFKSHRPDYRDGEQQRDFIYVKDAVAMTLHLADTPAAGGLYNVGSGKPRTWLDLGRAIFQAMGKKPQIEFIDMPENLRDQYQYHTCADIAKLRATGYRQPVTELEDAVSDYVKNYLQTGKHLGD